MLFDQVILFHFFEGGPVSTNIARCYGTRREHEAVCRGGIRRF